ncbi:MAG: hypothetical protein COA47_09945 [Robiginitomaculum sp.]|nr:MAG: hypothetical protein COA47_09945 [Robiginitomaculum sp.]
MASQTEARNGIEYDWDQGESTWKAGMDNNLRTIGSILNLSVIDIINDPPGSPSDGDAYIVLVGTGLWSGNDDNIAIWFNADAVWRFYVPTTGITSFVTTGTFANQLIAYNGTNWSTNGFTFTF